MTADFSTVKVGDVVTRLLGGVIPMLVNVTEITPAHIVCGPWVFDKQTGEEIDDDISCSVSRLDAAALRGA